MVGFLLQNIVFLWQVLFKGGHKIIFILPDVSQLRI
jgi:hypothetical protein